MVLLCFDMDNTLLRSNKVHIEAFNLAFVKFGLKKVKAEKLVEHFGKVGILVVMSVYPFLQEKEALKILHEHNRLVVNKTAKYARQIPGADNALKKLKKNGFKLALLTNCSHAEIKALLKNAKIDARVFDLFVGSDDVRHGKPWPDEILKAKAVLHAHTVYMVGDSVYDVMTGKRAKVKTISVLTGDFSRRQLLEEKPDYILRSAADVPRLMEKIYKK
ncbi:MAG: HAD family hydrolase [Candidatus Nanoarchaeia archaeon]|nr:HAD family hydrolase [Candidatus Nanoarchaeia archaeon]